MLKHLSEPKIPFRLFRYIFLTVYLITFISIYN